MRRFLVTATLITLLLATGASRAAATFNFVTDSVVVGLPGSEPFIVPLLNNLSVTMTSNGAALQWRPSFNPSPEVEVLFESGVSRLHCFFIECYLDGVFNIEGPAFRGDFFLGSADETLTGRIFYSTGFEDLTMSGGIVWTGVFVSDDTLFPSQITGHWVLVSVSEPNSIGLLLLALMLVLLIQDRVSGLPRRGLGLVRSRLNAR